MKIKFSKTRHFFSIDRYPARFGYRGADGKEINLGSGHVIIIRILGFEIKFDTIKKRKNTNKRS